MTDRMVALLSLGLFGAFLVPLGWWVEGWSIKIVLLIAFGMASYDFWLDTLRPNGRRD